VAAGYPIEPRERPPSIDGYGAGSFRIDGVLRSGSLIILPEGLLEWPVTGFAEVDATTLPPDLFGEAAVDLLLLGSGSRMAPLSFELRVALRAVGTVVEVMDTGAAVRTYNVLLGEQRRLAAALIAVN